GGESQRRVLGRAPGVVDGRRRIVDVEDVDGDGRRVGRADAVGDVVGEGVSSGEVRSGNVRAVAVRARHRAVGGPALDGVGERGRAHADRVQGEGLRGVLVDGDGLVGRARRVHAVRARLDAVLDRILDVREEVVAGQG